MNCDEFRSAVLGGLEDESTRAHEATCAVCRAHTADLRAAAVALAAPVVWEEPSPELGGQIEALIAGTAERGDGPAVSSPRKSRTPWIAAAGIAASLVLVLGVFGLGRSPAPDWEVALPATELAPGAVSTVQGWNEESGTRMIVAIEGLDPAPDGFIYEFWLSEGPIHISAGTFRTGGEIELWSGVSRADFPRLWVTLEEVDEDESPSRHTVLDTGGRST